MSKHANRVQMTVSGAPGTGAITLGAATSGHRSFGTAFGGDAIVDVLIVDGSAWEVARGCTYTHSGTTLSRGTLESSSTGSDIDLTSAAVVSVVATADAGRRWDAAALGEQVTVTGTSGGISAAVNTLYVADMSGWTADRTLTLPGAAAVGDRVGVMVAVGDADYEWLVTAAGGDTLNGVPGGTEWSRVFVAGEVLTFRRIEAAAWMVEHDGRIPCSCRIYLSGDTALASTSLTKCPLDTNDSTLDVGGLATLAGNGITPRRDGRYRAEGQIAILAVGAARFVLAQIAVAGTGVRTVSLMTTGLAAAQYVAGGVPLRLAAGQEVTILGQQNDSTSESWQGGNDAGTCDLSLVELL